MFMAMGQNLRYLFSRDYHLFKRLFKGHRGYGVLTHSHIYIYVCDFLFVCSWPGWEARVDSRRRPVAQAPVARECWPWSPAWPSFCLR